MSEDREAPLASAPYVRRPSRTTRAGIGDLHAATGAASDDQRAATGITWRAHEIPLDRILPSTTDRARARFRGSLPDLIWNTARYEGNAFTLPEVQTLLEGVTVGGRRLEDEEQVLALSDAYSTLERLVGGGEFTLSKAVSDRLHLLVAHHEAIESGHFRGEGQVSGGGNVRLSNGGTVAGVVAGESGLALIHRFDRTCEYLGAIDDPRERALAYFAAATRSQFYFDGNKRTARLMMTGELMTAGFEAVNIPFSRQYEFNVALDRLFETDDATRLMAFVADCA